MKNCILYSRVDEKFGFDNTTINVQLARLQRFASSNQLEVISAIRGYEPGIMTDRASLRLLRHEIADKKPDAVVVVSLDRLSKSARDLKSLIAEFRSNGVELISLKEGNCTGAFSPVRRSQPSLSERRGGALA